MKGAIMKKIICLFLLLFVSCAENAAESEALRDEIDKVLTSQVQSWNEGDIDGYMKYYLNSRELTFYSGGKLLSGWENIRQMYTEKYVEKEMGTLKFLGYEIEILSGDSAYVMGAWGLDMAESFKAGKFTLIMRKFEQGWRIVHDHSS
ncbi:MAG: DUF4440 domain-containing protein [Candidatus Latescibacteria bacterium]|nr:DUF4440 domain-containing protein [bacterium]MBD3424464.1 DUF4440 domain-containing protein [Candidatus Latescibacterota bacterium]